MESRKKLSLEDLIADLRSHLKTAEHSFLEQHGWRYTSSTPDSVWRWVKTIDDGTMIMTGHADALAMEGLPR